MSLIIVLDVIAIVYLWYVFLIIYHLIRFGIGTAPKKAAVFFFWGSVLLLLLTFYVFSNSNLNLFILK